VRFPYVILFALFVAAVAYGADSTLGTPSVTPTAAGPYGARIVPLGDGFLALWEQGEQCSYEELHGMRLDRDGHPRDKGDFIVVPAAYSLSIIAAESDGGDAFIEWAREDGSAIHLTRVSADTVTVISDSVPTPSQSIMRVSNGNILFVSSGGNLGVPLTATLLGRTGTVVRSGVKMVDQPGESIVAKDLVAVDGAFLLAWMSGDSHLRVARILPADVAANDVRITPADLGARTYVYSVRLASDGTHTMVFWGDYEGGKYGLRARSLSISGTPLGAGTLTIGSVTPSSDALTPLAVSDGYEVLFQEYVDGVNHPAFVRVSFDGTLQAVAHPPARIAATQNGGRTMAVWTESRFSMTDFYNYFAGYEIVTAPLAGDGSAGAGTVVSLDSSVQHVRKLVPFGGGVVALWTEGLPNDRLVVSRLTASGQPADGGLRLRDSIFHQSHGVIATDGERLFVAWTEGDQYKPQTLYGAIVSPGALTASVKSLAVDADGENDIAVVWNGQTFAVVYQRVRTGGHDFAALRVDRAGNAVDPIPIALTPTSYYDENPRLSWNGTDYLLVWQRWYDPFIYFGEQCFTRPAPLPAELFAQRFSTAFALTGPEIALATTTNKNDYKLDVQKVDVSFAGGQWLVLWLDKAAFGPRFARIGANGALLDPLNGRKVAGSFDDPVLAPAPDGWTIAAHEGYGSFGPGRGVALAHIGLDGIVTAMDTAPFSTSAVEAFVLTPSPLVAYKRSSSSAAFVGPLVQRSRAVHH
jgi:hypothetical protein